MILGAAAHIPLEEFSLRAVAKQLAVSAQSIYYYFPSKNALLAAMAEENITLFPEVDSHDWRSYLRTSLHGYRNWLLISDSAALAASNSSALARFNDEPSLGIMKLMEKFVTFFTAAGFTPGEALEVWNLGATLVVRSLKTSLGDKEIAEHWREIQDDIESLGAENFPSLSEALSQGPPSADEIFARIVETAIEGVSAVYKVA